MNNFIGILSAITGGLGGPSIWNPPYYSRKAVLPQEVRDEKVAKAEAKRERKRQRNRWNEVCK